MSEPVLGLVPARGGSKGIPRKNLLPVAGRPLIAHTIEHARASRGIGRVVVSTDDEEIAAVARECGAEVPFLRPADLARDDSPDIDVFRHALEWLRVHEGYEPELVVHLRPTMPVRRVEVIDDAIALLASRPDADAVRSVSPARQSPYKMWEIAPDGSLRPLLRLPGAADCQSLPRQRLPMALWQNGYVDVLRPRAVLEAGSMWGSLVLPLVVEGDLYELDYPEDIPAIEAALADGSGGVPAGARDVRHPV